MKNFNRLPDGKRPALGRSRRRCEDDNKMGIGDEGVYV